MTKIKWGVLGTAGIAKKCTIPGMLQVESCCLYAIAGRKPEKVAEFKEKFGFEKGYTSYEELLDDPEVEAVYIPLSNDLHCEWTIKALNKKKHVLCEKPLGVNAKQVEEMIAAANENGVFLMEAFAYLHSPFIAAMKNEIESGSIGKISYIESAFLTKGYEGLKNIRVRRETYGGSLYDVGCYCTSLSQWLIGEEPTEIEAAAEFTDQHIDIHTNAVLKYPGGARASISCGMCLEGDNRIDRWTICGTKGSIVSTEAFNGAGELKYTLCSEGKVEVKTISVPDNYSLEAAQLGRCISEGETPFVSNDFSVVNAKVMDRILNKIGY